MKLLQPDRILNQLLKPLFGGVGHIFMFHRVLPEARPPLAAGSSILEVTPQYLEDIILQLQQKDMEFISMDDVPHRLISKQKNPPFAVFTFDDGYVDNYLHVWPLFKKYHIPFTVYITTDFPDGKAILWWYLLEDLLASGGTWSYLSSETHLACDLKNPEQARTASLFIRKTLKNAESQKIPDLCRAIFPKMDILARTKSLALNWDQIREMSSAPLVTIGAHSLSHASLPSLSNQVMEEEIWKSKRRLEEETQKPARHFAYPFGGPLAVTAREVARVEKAGFSTAVTTYFANVFPEHINHLFALPRLDLPQLKDPANLDLALDGVISARFHRFKRVITY
jgi:peptidoglycan/xylan/chitin deacetylase (PgdA/CDA1 family)